MDGNLISKRNALKVFDSVSDGVIVVDLDHKIVHINKTAQKLLKYTEGEAIGSICKGVTKGSQCSTDCQFNRAMQIDGDIQGTEVNYRSKDGEILRCKTNVALLRDGDGKVIGGVEIFSNISEITRLQEAVEERYSFDNIVGRSRQIREVFEMVKMVSETDSTVLITGESGTGKELVANAIHYHSIRKAKPFVKVNCAALNEGVLESELFGHVRGAFTGAIAEKVGRFEMADSGTLFLDEVGEIPIPTQVKLLRVLQEGELERVGSSKTTKVNVRLVTATNKDLIQAITDGEFRSDLFYRLNVFHITLPPLRERPEDIPILVDHFMKKVAAKMPTKKIEGIATDAMSLLMDYGYPGNIRELENLIEHAAIRSKSGLIRAADLPSGVHNRLIADGTRLYHIRKPLENLEKDLITKTLEACDWKVQQTAENLGISRVTLWRKMKEYGVKRQQ